MYFDVLCKGLVKNNLSTLEDSGVNSSALNGTKFKVHTIQDALVFYEIKKFVTKICEK